MDNVPFDPKVLLSTMTSYPGVYRFLDNQGEVLYVGKARNLKRRLATYFQKTPKDPKTRALLATTASVEVTLTHTETEALILENHLIKATRPRFNVLLRDDKGYPFIHLSAHPFPRLHLHRGAKREGSFFGPYPQVQAAKETLQVLQRLFLLRPCEDSVFHHRTRPCLQYQIKRCSAPCVRLIDESRYAQEVKQAVAFLEGKGEEVIEDRLRRMEEAAQRLDFESAAVYRDQIARLRQVQQCQSMSTREGDLDVIAAWVEGGVGCIQLGMIRAGRHLGHRAFFPRHPLDVKAETLLSAFLSQHYLTHPPPPKVLVSHPPEDKVLIARALAQRSGHAVHILQGGRGERRRWIEMAMANARHALAQHLQRQNYQRGRLSALKETLGLETLPKRLECFDISHTQGEAAVASCVVFDSEGPKKADYRRFNITGIAPGDDYAALKQAIARRYRRRTLLPDVVFIDGGKGQLTAAREAMEDLGIAIPLVGIAKGDKAGEETLHTPRGPLRLSPRDPALHLIQALRDEAHRFALLGHRGRRAGGRRTSLLENIPGLGPKRHHQLIRRFGGWQAIAQAGIDDLVRIPGISKRLAQRIYDAFHGG